MTKEQTRRLRLHHLREDIKMTQLRKQYWVAGIVLVLAFFQLEIPRIIEQHWPEFAMRQYYPFIDKNYHFPQGGVMYMVWWLKYCSIDLKNIMIMGLVSWLLWSYSRRLGSAFLCYTLYYVVDHFLLWYNYRTAQWVFFVENAFNVVALIMLFLPEKRKAIVRPIKKESL